MNLPRPRSALVPCCVIALLSTACTRSNEGVSSANTSFSDGVAVTITSSEERGSEPVADDDEPVEAERDGGSTVGATAVAPESTPPISIVEVAELGVPGLDSTDAFCAAWSRFAGSFQVVAVTAAFGSGQPEQLAALEVAAAPVVSSSYDNLLANWPSELSSEADLVADDFLGPFARRLAVARDSLVAIGASDGMIATISDAWVTGLAQRDPSTPEFAVDLPDDAWAVIDEAAAHFADRLVAFNSDPSLVTNVETPLTNAYLAVSCPDQGTLSGQEVDAG